MIAALVACFLVTSSRAENDSVSRAEELYSRGEYLLIIDYIGSVLSDTLGLDAENRLSLLRILASSYVAVGNVESARTQFKKMLALDPDAQLDPVATSPKILSVFKEAKREYEAEQAARQAPESLSTDLLAARPEGRVWLGPAIKSLIIPGLGQFQNGHQTKGYVFISSEVVSIAGLLVSQVRYEEARKDYAGNRDMSKMDALYNDYNRWYMVRNGFIATSVGICLVSSVDAIIGALEGTLGNSTPEVGLVPAGSGFYAYLRF
ncbi:MAG: hypothetical protein ACE5JA_01140 [bacterium]